METISKTTENTLEELLELEMRAYNVYSMASDEAEEMKRDRPSSFKTLEDKEYYTSEINRLFKVSYQHLELADHYKNLINKHPEWQGQTTY